MLAGTRRESWVHTPSQDNRLPDVLLRDPQPPRPKLKIQKTAER